MKILLFSLEFFKNKKQSYQTDTCETAWANKYTWSGVGLCNV